MASEKAPLLSGRAGPSPEGAVYGDEYEPLLRNLPRNNSLLPIAASQGPLSINQASDAAASAAVASSSRPLHSPPPLEDQPPSLPTAPSVGTKRPTLRLVYIFTFINMLAVQACFPILYLYFTAQGTVLCVLCVCVC
jgi:hypothetical protein